jgi:Carboxypeptidase regulatory-like domain
MRLHRNWRVSILALLLLGISGTDVFAQVPTGTIEGTVKDSQGLSVSGATVTLTNEGTARTQTDKTSSRGAFQFSYLTVGVFRVEVSKTGFKIFVVNGIKLDTSTEYSVPPITLEVGALTDTVTIEADANVVRTAGAEITDTVERKQIEELPILDRNPMSLLSLQAGVSQNRHASGLFVTVIDGQRQSFSNVTLDGINIQDNYVRSASLDYTPNYLVMSQVGEFTTTTQNAGSQAGLGSSQVSVVTPSGTNNWHGEGFWYYRSGALAANDWFNDANGIEKPNLLQNQGGGQIGGPVHKDKLFVYGAYELFRRRQQIPTNTTVLTSASRTGVFQWRADCATSCPSGVTNGSLQSLNLLTLKGLSMDPFIGGLLARVPTAINNPSIGDGLNTGGYSFNQRDNETRDNTSMRLDWYPAAHHSFSGTYAWNRDVLDRPGSGLGLTNTYDAVPPSYNNDKENFLSDAWRWTPSPNFTNEVRFGFDLAPINFLTNQKFGSFTVSNTLFNNPDQNFFSQGRKSHTWSWQDNASWSHGNHTLNFGIQVQRVTVFAQNYANTLPNLNLDYTLSTNSNLVSSGDFSSQGGITSADLATAKQLLSTLAGLVGSETQTFNVTSRTSGYIPGASDAQNFRYNNWSLYSGDSWKLRRNLTLTYGLRWEYNSPFDERDGLLQFPIVPAGQTIQQTLLSDASLNYFGGNSGRPVYRKDLNNFAPNIGVAWDPFGDGKTSIRAGYSINYVNDELIGAPYNASLSNPGVSVQTGPSYLPSTTIGNPQRIPIPTMSNTFSGNWANLYSYNTGISYGYAVDPNLRTPYVQQWNLSIQREIGWNSSVTVSYVGNKGTKLYRAIDLNQVTIKNNGFLSAFNLARQNGFTSLAANGVFNPCYTPTGSDCSNRNPNVAYFADNFFGGLLDTPGYAGLISQYMQQGAVGNLADLYHSIAYDAAYFSAPVSLAPNQYLRAADLLGNYSSSSYNAGSVEIRRRFRQGLNFQGSYTFSKVFTDYSADTNVGVERFFPYLDNAQPGLERSRANFDLSHAFKANFLYELPVGRGHHWAPSNGVVNKLVSSWIMSSIFTWQSGAPFSIFSGEGTLNRSARSLLTNTAYTASTPQQIASQLGTYQSNGEVLLINPKYIGPDGRGAPSDSVTCTPLVSGGFCNPQPGSVGSLPRNAFNGPVFFNWDLGILKGIPITESKNLEFRVEMFNAPNHPTFAVGNSNFLVANPGASSSDMYINDPNFGVATSTASTPRVIQMGMRFVF